MAHKNAVKRALFLDTSLLQFSFTTQNTVTEPKHSHNADCINKMSSFLYKINSLIQMFWFQIEEDSNREIG